MKKKNLKILELNKKAISSMNSNTKSGGVKGKEKNKLPCYSYNDAATCGWACTDFTNTWSGRP